MIREVGSLGKLLRARTHFVIVREAAKRFNIMHIWHALPNRRQPKRKDEINKHVHENEKQPLWLHVFVHDAKGQS